jgi:hypothetical protein
MKSSAEEAGFDLTREFLLKLEKDTCRLMGHPGITEEFKEYLKKVYQDARTFYNEGAWLT